MKKAINYIIWPILVAPLAYLAAVWQKLPEKVPMHYNIRGEVDRYGNRKELLFLLIGMFALNIGLYFLLTNLDRIDPKRKYNANNKQKLQRMAIAVCLFMSAITCYILYTSSAGHTSLKPNFIVIIVGILLAVLGNYMYNIKPNYFAGLRLPWTLQSDSNWKKTHLLAGKLWFTGGLLIAIAGLLLPSKALFIFLIIAVALLVIVPVVYSYREYKKESAGL